MESLFEGTDPTPNSIYNWVSSNVKVITDGYNGYVYKINPGGFMTQFVSKEIIINKLSINILYKNTSKTPINSELILTGDNENNAKYLISLPVNESYELISFDVDINTISIESIALEIKTSTNQSINIKSIEILAEIEQKENTTNSQDFSKYAILYGLDENKPKIEVIESGTTIS